MAFLWLESSSSGYDFFIRASVALEQGVRMVQLPSNCDCNPFGGLVSKMTFIRKH
jgi:hypothetical protein